MPLASQKSVDYSQGEACEFCTFFVADGENCQKVQGPIHDDMWCKLFERTQTEHDTPGEKDESVPVANKGRLPPRHIALILVGKPSDER